MAETTWEPTACPNNDSSDLFLETLLLVDQFLDFPVKKKMILVLAVMGLVVITVITRKLVLYLYNKYINKRTDPFIAKLTWITKVYKTYVQTRVGWHLLSLLLNTEFMIFIQGWIVDRWKVVLAIFILQHLLWLFVRKRFKTLKPEQIKIRHRIVFLINTPCFRIGIQILVLLLTRKRIA